MDWVGGGVDMGTGAYEGQYNARLQVCRFALPVTLREYVMSELPSGV